MELKGKVALVTGSSNGIGKAIAVMLAQQGADVIVSYYKDEEGALDTLQQVKDAGSDGIIVKADTGKTEGIEFIIQQSLARFAKIDILVNNAGICPFRDFFDVTEEVLDRTINVNLKGYFLMTQKVAKHMADNGLRGRIVNISSISGIVGSETQVHYCATKGGINTLTKASAKALGKYGITVNAVLPGTVKTNANVGQLSDDEVVNDILSKTPIGTFGTTRNIAEAVKYFVSDQADWTTGSLLVVDGGYIA